MPWYPQEGSPKNIRELFYWAYRQFKLMSAYYDAVPPGSGVPEAPNDANQYTRGQLAWNVASPGGAAGKVLIQTITNVSAGEFDFNSIPQIYKSLILEHEVRCTIGSGTIAGMRLFINGDTTDANYLGQYCRGSNGGSVFVEVAGALGGVAPVAGSPANSYAQTETKIQDYTKTSRLKQYKTTFTCLSVGGSGTAGRIDTGVIGTASRVITAAVTRLQLRALTHPTDGLIGEARLYGVV